jgi:hypothetical protein
MASSVIVAAGAISARVSASATRAEITLSPGQSISVPVFRLFPASIAISLEFFRTPGTRRPELGEFVSSDGPGFIEFKSPGEPIVVNVKGPHAAARFEALPAGGYGVESIQRTLVVLENDGNPRRFPWPGNYERVPKLPRGASMVAITVEDVGQAILGERVTVVLEPPLSFKGAATGYGFLWWFFFWPVFAACLLLYSCYLVWDMRKHQTRQSREA